MNARALQEGIKALGAVLHFNTVSFEKVPTARGAQRHLLQEYFTCTHDVCLAAIVRARLYSLILAGLVLLPPDTRPAIQEIQRRNGTGEKKRISTLKSASLERKNLKSLGTPKILGPQRTAALC